MARKQLLECSFLIPIHRDRILSDGKAQLTTTWTWLEQELLGFGGVTRAPDLYKGFYVDRDTGEPVWDRSRKYFVALPRVQVDAPRALLREACGKFAQKCIYLSVAGRVEFVEGENRGSR